MQLYALFITSQYRSFIFKDFSQIYLKVAICWKILKSRPTEGDFHTIRKHCGDLCINDGHLSASTVTHIRITTELEAVQTHCRRAWLSLHVNLNSHISKGKISYSSNSLVLFSICKKHKAILFSRRILHHTDPLVVCAHLEGNIMETVPLGS